MKNRFVQSNVVVLLFLFSLTACGNTTSSLSESGTIKYGEADGFGDVVQVELTMQDGMVSAAKLTADRETPHLDSAPEDWKEQLEERIVLAGGPDFDTVSGATYTSAAVRKAVAQALDMEVPEKYKDIEVPSQNASQQTSESNKLPEGGIKIGQIITAVHGKKGFAQITAVINEDVIIADYIDEYQIGTMGEVVAVPNGEDREHFGAGFEEEQVLYSKRINADYYSAKMKEIAQSTTSITDNFEAIQAYAVGKHISELASLQADQNTTDAVSGATLKDTGIYLNAIAKAAEVARETSGIAYEGDLDTLKLKMSIGAAQGNNCFSTAAVLSDDKAVLLAWIDEFQFATTGTVNSVPNGEDEENLGAGFVPDQVLFSKRVNADYYSSLMKEYANSTIPINENYDAIQIYVRGKTIAEIEEIAAQKDAAVDAISSATLTDTDGYLSLIAEGAK